MCQKASDSRYIICHTESIFISTILAEQSDVPKIKLQPKKVAQLRLANGLTVNQCGNSTEARKQRVFPLNLRMLGVKKEQH